MARRLTAENALALLLVFVLITVVLEYFVHASPTTLFVTSAIAVLVVGQISDDGECHWMEGALLLGVYLIIGLAFLNAP